MRQIEFKATINTKDDSDVNLEALQTWLESGIDFVLDEGHDAFDNFSRKCMSVVNTSIREIKD